MSDESAFLHAIAAEPSDNTARLVYADWLDEHAEPCKAAFLRTECEWAAEPTPAELVRAWDSKLQSNEGRYPPAFRRLTQLAERVPLNWMRVVSSVGEKTRQLIERFSALVPGGVFCRTTDDDECAAVWDSAVSWARGRVFPEHLARDRFSVPVDYVVYSLAGGVLSGPDGFWSLSHPEIVLEQTVIDYDMYAEIHPFDGEPPCGLWLNVGGCCVAHQYQFLYLCCDRFSPLFGAVAELSDGLPDGKSRLPKDGPRYSDLIARCFYDFLRYQVARVEREQPNG